MRQVTEEVKSKRPKYTHAELSAYRAPFYQLEDIVSLAMAGPVDIIYDGIQMHEIFWRYANGRV